MENTLSQKDYLDLICESAKTIQKVKASGEDVDEKQVAELWSIYYNAFAGALRSGMMFSKTMDYDGYPKYQINIGDRKFVCRDAALRDILKEDYDQITKFPYQDTSESYVKAYTLVDDYPELELENITSAASGEEKPDPMDADVQAKLKKKIMQAEKKKKEAILREKNRQLLKDARGFDYDPNYDHYNSDRLPEILQELDSSAMDNAARIVSIVVSVAGIFLALALL